jgi:RNA polymerase sigma-B factor
MGADAGNGRTGGAAAAAHALRTYLATGDTAARDDLVQHYLPLVITIARRYEHCGEPLEDLVQVGSIGLINAIDRFDPARGTKLSSFAIPTIEGEIRRELRDRGSTVRLPRSVQAARTSVLRSRDELAAQL